jgi:hypothetical protein
LSWGDESAYNNFQCGTGSKLDIHLANNEFVRDWLRALGRARRKGQVGKASFLDDTCVYHEHRATGKPCYKEKFHLKNTWS